MNQLIFTDFGIIVGIDESLTEETMHRVRESVMAWAENKHVLVLPIADWEIVDKRRDAA